MTRNSQRGVALVITLIMLALVTAMAITFLAISRRQRTSVQVTVDQTDANNMADAALARAEAAVAAQIVASGTTAGYGLTVSTNFINPEGYVTEPGFDPNNVNYDFRVGGGVLSANDRIQNIANLFYSPRPPVYINTNDNAPLDFRFYLDLNRNGRFESNGWYQALNDLGYPTTVNGAPLTNFFVGDPEWIGVLARPDLPHSSSNQFVGRIAYLVLPEGRSLDLNFIHNQAKHLGATTEGFFRNQGFGSWEINLAAFLADLDTNAWPTYVYNPALTAPSGGLAFEDALTLVRQRYDDDYRRLASIQTLFGPVGAAAFRQDGIDGYADGPLMTGAPLPSGQPVDNDNPQAPWPGSDNAQSLYDVQQLFSLTSTNQDLQTALNAFTTRLRAVMTRRSSYDRYAFYRLLGQMGVDSAPATAGRMNLNYATDINRNATNLVPWTPLGFFTNAADLMLKASIITNIDRGVTNYLIGDTLVRPDISVTNIELYPTNEYTSSVHRLLQVAANLYDATTNGPIQSYPYVPSVFRPYFRRSATNVTIAGFMQVTNLVFTSHPWLDLGQLAANPVGVYTNVNLHGQPFVVGARKGYPNFNELDSQTALRITRKLELVKPAPAAPPSQTNQMYLLSITNRLGVEAWNSYTNAYPWPLTLWVSNYYTLRLDNPTTLLFETNVVSRYVNYFPPRSWAGQHFEVPILTNTTILPNLVYKPTLAPFFFDTAQFDNGLGTQPVWLLSVTNRTEYFLFDDRFSPPRLVDYTSLVSVQQDTNIIERMRQALRNNVLATFWGLDPNGSAMSAITNQVAASEGIIPINQNVWLSANLSPAPGLDKDKAIAYFQYFMNGRTTGPYQTYEMEARQQVGTALREQTPFNPSPILYYSDRREANDPLVHYLLADLRPGGSTNAWPADPAPTFTLGTSNRTANAYSPWGKSFALFPSANVGPTDTAFKDPLVRSSDDWNFPTNKFPSIGWIGRVHRGTPWQTVYLKSTMPDPKQWAFWSGSLGTNPTNDWRLLDLFTVAPNPNAARGLLSVDQTNLAAWSAVLSGVNVLGNRFIQPNSTQLRQIVDGINATRATRPQHIFQHMGDVLATPQLSVASPFLTLNNPTNTDVTVERIPQQILSLLQPDDPRVVIYSFGQALKPAENSLVMSGTHFRLCTNYQITAETATKAVVRFEGGTNNPHAIIESYSVIPSD
jgi:hypothetical protein